jgi:predicted HTH transcriptional regulator
MPDRLRRDKIITILARLAEPVSTTYIARRLQISHRAAQRTLSDLRRANVLMQVKIPGTSLWKLVDEIWMT